MGSSAFLQNLAKKQQKKDTDDTGRRTDEVRDTLLRTNRKPQAATLSTATAGRPAVPLRSNGTLRSQGQAVDVVRDTGLKRAVGTLREKAKAPQVKINTDKGFTVQNTTVNPRIGWAAADMTKSKAKDEKTRLYETNDSLLNSGEIIRKYQYVAQDQDMDYATLRRAVNKGLSEVGRTLRGTNDNSRFETVAKLQTQLQGRLKSASFTAGLLDAMGGDIRDIVAKASGNEGMQKWNEDWHKQIAETKANHPAAATLGAFTGEAGKAAAGYMTIGKAAEKAALAGAEKLGQRMTAATASDAAQKLAAKMLLDPKKAKAAQFATRMLGQQVADTAVNTPITIAAGLAEGKSRDEIGKDVAKQVALDAAFNLGLEGLGAAARAAKNVSGYKTKKEGYQAPDAISPQPDVRNANELPSANNIAQEGGNVKETGLIRRNLLPEEKIPESLRQEYRDLNDPNYMDAKLRQMIETYGDDREGFAREMNRLNSRREELEEMLGIRTKKVKDTERHINAEAIKEIKQILSLSGKEETEEIRSMIRQATTEGRTGKISQETRERIFNELFDIGRINNRADIDQELKQRLKGLKLRISPRDAANIPDFQQWRKGTFGKIGSVGVDHRGNIDTQWMELNAQWPHLFPEEITNPAEQLQRIKAVADEMTYRDIPLAETIDTEAKAGIRADFDAAMDRLESNMQKLTAYTNDRAERQARRLMLEGELPDYDTLSTGDVKAIYDERYRLQQAAEKVRRKKTLTEGDQLALQKLLRGEIDAETARKYAGLNADDLMELYAVEKPLYRVEKSLQEYKKRANRKHYDEIADVVGDMPIRNGSKEGWRDLAALRLARETQERILDMIAPNRKKAAQVREAVFDPIHESERQRSLFKEERIGRIQQLGISTKNDISVKLPDGQAGKTSESALVQWLGENRYQLRQMEKKKGRATAEDIAQEQELRRRIGQVESSISKERLQKIDDAIAEMTEIYKEIHPKINEVLIRNGYEPAGYIEGYFPHMNFDDPNNLLEKAAQKLGFDFASKELPMDIAGRTETFRPGKKWAGNLLTREGKETDYDALRAFDLYLDNISDVIYHTDNIKRLRAYEDYMRYTLSDAGIKEKVDAIRNNIDLSETEKSKRIEEVYEGVQNHSLQNYVNNIRTYTDLLAGKKHKIDRVLETELFGRKVYKVVSEIENRVAGNMVAGNIGSALTNFIPITQGMSSMSIKSNLQGLGEALAYMSKGEMDELTKKSAFLATREGNDLLYKTTMRRISDAAGKPMEWADKFTTQAVWRSRYYDNVAKGMSEEAAIKNADAFARGLFGGRSKGAMPTAFSAKALKPLTMFQLEVNNQISYLLKDIPKEAQGSVRKMMQAYGGIVIGAYIYNDVYEKLTGRRSALDPFSIANEAFGDLTGRQVRNTLDILGGLSEGELQLTEQVEKKKPSQAITELSKEIGGNVPFVGGLLFDGGRIPMKSAIPSPTKIIGAMGNMKSGDDTEAKGWQTIRKEAEKPLWYLGMPVAGGQIRKTMQGLETMQKGGSYNQTNKGPELQFPVDQEKKGQWAKAALFGKWATEGGQQHLEKDRHLGTDQTETYQKLVTAGVKNTLAFETIDRIRKKDKDAEKRKEIRQAGMSKEQQSILYYDLVLEKDSKDREILDYFRKQKNIHNKNVDIGEIYDCLSRMAEHGDKVTPKRNVLKASSLKNDEKKYIYLNKIVDKDDREKERTKVSALEKYGVKMDDYLKIKNKYAQIDNNGEKPKAKAAEMSQWLSNAGFTSQQLAAIKEQFAFWGMYKQEYK